MEAGMAIRRLVMIAPLLLVMGCSRAPDPDGRLGGDPGLAGQTEGTVGEAEAVEGSGKVKVTAYINVSSGCQADTVYLVRELGMENAELVDLEMVDFGAPEGEERWKGDGLECMAILFDGSPVLRFPGADGEEKTAVFFMPAGFGWGHEDLEEAFGALKAGTLEILSKEEAEQELAPVPVEIETQVREIDGGGEVVMGERTAFTVNVEAGGKSAIERAEAAKAAIDEWTAGPVHPSQLTIIEEEGAATILGKDIMIIRVTSADAEDAEVKKAKKLANEWLKGIRMSVVEAVREGTGEGQGTAG